jgi:hypothetical protein
MSRGIPTLTDRKRAITSPNDDRAASVYFSPLEAVSDSLPSPAGKISTGGSSYPFRLL